MFSIPDLTLDPESDGIDGRVDLDGDGVADVGLVVGSASVPDADGNSGLVLGGGLAGAEIAFSGRYPIAFQASEVIDPSLSFRTAIGTLALSSGGLLGGRGEWFGGEDAYLGARFTVGEQYFYGWVHAIWDPQDNTLVVDLAAYEESGGAAGILPQPSEPEEFAITLLSGTDVAAGRVELSWPMLAGKDYELQRSVDLKDWEVIHRVTPSIDRGEVFVDEDPGGGSLEGRRFYRVKQTRKESALLLLALGYPSRRRKRACAGR